MNLVNGIARTTAVAPGSIGNVGPGLDVLGAAIVGTGDSVTAEWFEGIGIKVLHAGDRSLSRDPEKHSSAIAADAVLQTLYRRGFELGGQGIALSVSKGLPLSAGQGGSAASAVAGAVAVNALLGSPLQRSELLAAALVAEERVAGRHLDNIAPSLMGGIILTRSLDPIDVIRLPIPKGLWIVIVHPQQELRTAVARAVLPAEIPRAVALHQMAHVAAMVAALYEGDVARFGRAIDDRIAEPVRAPLLPGFAEAKQAALAAGASGCSISGSGPTAFAICDSERRAYPTLVAMREAYRRCNIETEGRVTQIDTKGTLVTLHGDPRR